MKLMRSTEALKEYFAEGQMDIRTLNEAIARGDVPGQVWKMGKVPRYFVDVEQFEGRTGNELVDRVLSHAGR